MISYIFNFNIKQLLVLYSPTIIYFASPVVLLSKIFILDVNKNINQVSCFTCPTTSPKCSGVRRSADPTKHRHPLAHGGVEVVVIRNGGDAKTGVVLRCGVCPIMVAGGSERVAGVPVVCQFGCFLILALHTAHYL